MCRAPSHTKSNGRDMGGPRLGNMDVLKMCWKCQFWLKFVVFSVSEAAWNRDAPGGAVG